MASFDLALEFANANPQIEYNSLPIMVKAFKTDDESMDKNVLAAGPVIASLLKEQGAWMVILLNTDTSFYYLTAADIRKSLESTAARACRSNCPTPPTAKTE